MSDTDDNHSDDGQQPAPQLAHDRPQTGIKGVLADYRQHQWELQQQERRRLQEQKAAAPHIAVPQAHEQTMFSKSDNESDSESDSDSDLEEILNEYRTQRMAELNMRDTTPTEYVEIVDAQAATDTYIAVLLVDGCAASQRLEKFIRAEVGSFLNTLFLRVPARDCGFTDPHVIPIILVYRHGELKHNLVRVVGQFSDSHDFGQHDVAQLLGRVLS
ncbi:hypothetical protein IWW55_000638 [Coemansia sp. RSA 2706]|nr:hypothetical protein LPJ70_001970 [Coemansia sp. RSA 2708]KAJ2308091.1 hypothetical protein IWW55_000638 [Coemansia sp. RSA 2706]KAJ2313056.1 hypothetical protein IWW54_001732 [Coemansia sp. RSA 2705]KAJ2327544.1 hypothetical protein IWW51_001691 [Coemansia sp. RSA 2702]KAJ2367752.1 hypothetical protein H4S01_001980 [Coemansia sp. RSA 2610]KAJ2389006.1 hypothetical protein H4S02_002585 [Coemansia sp. RSA 2611]